MKLALGVVFQVNGKPMAELTVDEYGNKVISITGTMKIIIRSEGIFRIGN